MGPGDQRTGKKRTLRKRVRSMFTERNFLIGLIFVLIGMNIWIATVPYDPMNGDKADATTNVIWSDYYREGKVVVTYDEWQEDGQPPTQSSIIEIDGEPYVINEKGPAHAIFCMVLGPATGSVFVIIAIMSTYMLGRRIFCWQVGAIASLIVLTNLTVMIMWHRFFWVDTSTMHLMVLGMWLLVESGLRMKDHISKGQVGLSKDLTKAVIFGIGGGVAFGASVATRYTVGIVLIAAIIYVLALFWGSLALNVKDRDWKAMARTWARAFVLFLPFLLGLLIVMVPLMDYNNTYFGGPFNSGYDPMTVRDYEASGGVINPRNQTDWVSTNPLDKVENVAHNSLVLAPIILSRVMAILFVPFAIWKLRKRPILYLLLPWALLVFIAFLSLGWVDMYANMLGVVQEPRYHLPALPPIALMAGFVIDHASKKPNPGRRSAAFTIAIVVMLALPNIALAETHFKEVRDGTLGNFNPNKPPPRGPALVTVKELYEDPMKFETNLVQLKGCTITFMEKDVDDEIKFFEMTDGTDDRALAVRPMDFPSGTLPQLGVGDTVTVIGMFEFRDENGNHKPDEKELVVKVKHGTQDKIVKEG